MIKYILWAFLVMVAGRVYAGDVSSPGMDAMHSLCNDPQAFRLYNARHDAMLLHAGVDHRVYLLKADCSKLLFVYRGDDPVSDPWYWRRDGQWFYISAFNSGLLEVDVEHDRTRQIVTHETEENGDGTYGMAMSPDESRVVTWGADRCITLTDLATLRHQTLIRRVRMPEDLTVTWISNTAIRIKERGGHSRTIQVQ